jgi:hypothetical protein
LHQLQEPLQQQQRELLGPQPQLQARPVRLLQPQERQQFLLQQGPQLL